MRRLLAALGALAVSSCALGPPPARSGITPESEDAALEAVVRNVLLRYDAVEAPVPARGGYCLALGRGNRDRLLDPNRELLERFADRGDVHGSTWCVSHTGRLITLRPIRWTGTATVAVGVAVKEVAREPAATCLARATLRDGRWEAACPAS